MVNLMPLGQQPPCVCGMKTTAFAELAIIISMKFGRIKRQHGRIRGLDQILNHIAANCPPVSRIVPGRIKTRPAQTPPSFEIQDPTPAALKSLYTPTGTVQEVFLSCSDADAA